MKRWTFRILFCLLLGAVTTMAVAWGLAALIDVGAIRHEVEMLPSDVGGITESTIMPYRFHYRRSGAWCVVRANVTSRDRRVRTMLAYDPTLPFDDECPAWADDPSSLPSASENVFDARGFPMLALTGMTEVDATTIDAFWKRSLYRVDRGRQPQLAMRVLPLRPIFPGFIIDTLLYAVIWFGLIFGWRAHMRVIRSWQGHCPMCNYDLRGDMELGCPECGWNREP